MRGALLALALLAAAPTAPTAAVAQPASPLASLIADFEAYERREDPVTAGQEGDKDALRRWPDPTPAGDVRRKAALEGFRTRLRAVPAAGLTGEDVVNRAMLERIFAERLEAIALDGARFSLDFEGGPGGLVHYVGETTTLASAADAEAWLARLEGVPALYTAATANLRRGMATGWTQPKPVVDSAVAVLTAEAALTPASDPLLKPFATLPTSMPAAERDALRRRGEQVVAARIVPARREFLRFIGGEYAAKARPKDGVGSVPQGAAYYASQVRLHTTTDLTPQQIHDIGQGEVRRIRGLMDGVLKESGFKGDFAQFQAFLRTDKQFHAASREDLLEKAALLAKRSEDKLPQLFGTLPRLPFTVRPTPREIEEQTTTARYYPGSPKNGVAGGYIVNTGDLPARGLYELPALTVHEAVPGHHLQIALQQELDQLPYFRRNAQPTAFVEGWGLYAEFLGEEMGMYTTPYEKFGRLSYEMWRACRLVADTGIHALGWTKEEARRCFTDNSALSAKNIEAELNRYIGWPGQALAYKIGELKFRELRKRAETALGPRFDIRRFHDAVLLSGALPLDAVEAKIDAWIATEKARPAA